MTMENAPAPSRTRWFSANPDKAWAEKFFLTYVPIFFLYNVVVSTETGLVAKCDSARED